MKLKVRLLFRTETSISNISSDKCLIINTLKGGIMKRHRKRNSKNSTDLLVRIKNLEDELFNLRRAYSLHHSQTESFFMFLSEFKFSESERKRLEKLLFFDSENVISRVDLIYQLNKVLSPTHQLVMDELMLSLKNSKMFTRLVNLYFETPLNPLNIRRIKASDKFQRQAYGYSKNLVENCGFDECLIGEMTEDQAEKWYQSVLNHPCKWILETDQMIGVLSLRVNENDHKAKLAIELYDDASCGKGLGTIAVRYALDYGFEVLGLNKIYLRVLDSNTRALKCYLKCGFVEEGRDRMGSYINGKYCTDIYMGILKSEYSPIPDRGDFE